MLAIGLHVTNIIGCSFDGAPNMRSDAVGVVHWIHEENINCIYLWCLSHRFNLVVNTATNASERIKRVLRIAEDSAKLFRSSYIKMNVWTKVVKDIPKFSSQRKLKLIGTTRWSSKQDAIASIICKEINFFVLIKALIKVCSLENLDGDSLTKACDAFNSWLNYENGVTTFMLNKIFLLINPTTKSRQQSSLCLLDGIQSLKESNQRLQEFKNNMDDYIQQAESFIEKTNHLINNDDEMIALECECNIRIPATEEKKIINELIIKEFKMFIETLINETNVKILLAFDGTDSVYREMKYLDPTYSLNPANADITINMKRLCELNDVDEYDTAVELKELLSDFTQYQNRPQYEIVLNYEHYSADDDEYAYDTSVIIEDEADFDETTAYVQYNNINTVPMQINKCHCLECMMKFMADDARKAKYQNIFKLYMFVATLPSTQVKCERDFSKMKLLKTRLRSNLDDQSLEDMIIISTESHMFANINLSDIIDDVIFNSARISMCDFLSA